TSMSYFQARNSSGKPDKKNPDFFVQLIFWNPLRQKRASTEWSLHIETVFGIIDFRNTSAEWREDT
ncbi:MAG TPA: hypothetical protein VMM56_14065, partial [Planctomycetaceae bacterium]|nr:hypothetical protein [Planctomycetaceae bacterium]